MKHDRRREEALTVVAGRLGKQGDLRLVTPTAKGSAPPHNPHICEARHTRTAKASLLTTPIEPNSIP